MSEIHGDRCPECRAMQVVSKRGGHWRCLACGWWVETCEGMLVGSYMGDFPNEKDREHQRFHENLFATERRRLEERYQELVDRCVSRSP